MTLTVTEPPRWAPVDDTPTPSLEMVGTYYDVAVSDIGDDGDVFALGHIDKRRALAAFMRHARKCWGRDMFDVLRPTPSDAVDWISHRWMVNEGDDQEWCLKPAEPSDPGAFPVTWWYA